MKKAWILFLGLFAIVSLQAQDKKGVFKFETEMHAFGEVTEGDKAEHIFKFENVGDAPIVITYVRASCGCTTPQWSREPVQPGEFGMIKAVYNSKGRPGNFTKSITVNSNASEPVKVLKISGNVVRDPSKLAERESNTGFSLNATDKPALALVAKEYNFGTLELGQTVTRKFKYTNTGKADLSIKNVYSKCRCTKFKTSHDFLKPGETAELEITYTPNKATEAPEKLYIASNAPYSAENFILLKGKVVKKLVPESILKEDNFKF